jgi:diguanylate cyclase (GGDEF)-like protein
MTTHKEEHRIWPITTTQQQSIHLWRVNFNNNYLVNFEITIARYVRFYQRPEMIMRLFEGLEVLEEELRTRGISITDRSVPILKRILMYQRRATARDVEKSSRNTHHLELLNALEAMLHPLDELLQKDWIVVAKPMEIPRLADYLTIDCIEDLQRSQGTLPERQYDEKFNTLQAARVFLQDLEYYRGQCDARGLPVTVGFIDIDNFKKQFNERYTEETVDRDVLPRFMECLEAHIFSHGHAYRLGGDEYLALLAEHELGLCRRLSERSTTKTPSAKIPRHRGVYHSLGRRLPRGTGFLPNQQRCSRKGELGKEIREKTWRRLSCHLQGAD